MPPKKLIIKAANKCSHIFINLIIEVLHLSFIHLEQNNQWSWDVPYCIEKILTIILCMFVQFDISLVNALRILDTYGSSFDIVHLHPKINIFTLYFTHSVVHICKAENMSLTFKKRKQLY